LTGTVNHAESATVCGSAIDERPQKTAGPPSPQQTTRAWARRSTTISTPFFGFVDDE
jgi:hypothetical protein